MWHAILWCSINDSHLQVLSRSTACMYLYVLCRTVKPQPRFQAYPSSIYVDNNAIVSCPHFVHYFRSEVGGCLYWNIWLALTIRTFKHKDVVFWENSRWLCYSWTAISYHGRFPKRQVEGLGCSDMSTSKGGAGCLLKGGVLARDYGTCKRRSSKKRGGPGSMHHVSDVGRM